MNRANNIENPQFFCIWCRAGFPSSNHLKCHERECNVERINAYTLGSFSRGMRGPVPTSVVHQIRNAKTDEEAEEIFRDAMALVGVGVSNERNSIPILNIQETFSKSSGVR